PDAEYHHVHHHRVGDVLRAREAGLDQREAGLHKEHQETCQEQPQYVCGCGKELKLIVHEKQLSFRLFNLVVSRCGVRLNFQMTSRMSMTAIVSNGAPEYGDPLAPWPS